MARGFDTRCRFLSGIRPGGTARSAQVIRDQGSGFTLLANIMRSGTRIRLRIRAQQESLPEQVDSAWTVRGTRPVPLTRTVTEHCCRNFFFFFNCLFLRLGVASSAEEPQNNSLANRRKWVEKQREGERERRNANQSGRAYEVDGSRERESFVHA